MNTEKKDNLLASVGGSVGAIAGGGIGAFVAPEKHRTAGAIVGAVALGVVWSWYLGDLRYWGPENQSTGVSGRDPIFP